jgi:hypothetical protein
MDKEMRMIGIITPAVYLHHLWFLEYFQCLIFVAQNVHTKNCTQFLNWGRKHAMQQIWGKLIWAKGLSSTTQSNLTEITTLQGHVGYYDLDLQIRRTN